MYLILALGLGLILFCKYASDKHSTKNFEAQYESEIQQSDSFICKYAISFDEMNRIKRMVEAKDSAIVDFSDELCEIIKMTPTPPMIVWGFLAKHGRLPRWTDVYYWDSNNPLANEHDLIWRDVTGWKHLDIQEIREARLRFLLWYDKELRSHGIEERLLYIPANYTLIGKKQWASYDLWYDIKDAKPISECHDLICKITNANVVRAKDMKVSDTYPVMVCWKPTAVYAPRVYTERS